MILPPGHNVETVLRPARLGRRERRLVAGALALTLALVIGIVISIATPDHVSGKGCIDYGFAYSVGGQDVYRCGQSARDTCATLSRQGYASGTLDAATRACRKAGLAIG